MIIALSAAASASSSCPGGVFRDAARPAAVPPSPARTVRRSRQVEIALDRIFSTHDAPSAATAARELTLNLFGDVCVTAHVRRTVDLAPGKVEWVGSVDPHGELILVIDRDVMVGRLRRDHEVFEIRSLGGGVHLVSELDPMAFPRD